MVWYVALSIVGVLSLAILILRGAEYCQLKKWRSWKCPNCGSQYELSGYCEAKLIAISEYSSGDTSHAHHRRLSGVALTCKQCSKQTSFTRSGGLLRG